MFSSVNISILLSLLRVHYLWNEGKEKKVSEYLHISSSIVLLVWMLNMDNCNNKWNSSIIHLLNNSILISWLSANIIWEYWYVLCSMCVFRSKTLYFQIQWSRYTTCVHHLPAPSPLSNDASASFLLGKFWSAWIFV